MVDDSNHGVLRTYNANRVTVGPQIPAIGQIVLQPRLLSYTNSCYVK